MAWEQDHVHFEQVLDVTAELDCPHDGVVSVPMLDLLVPSPARLHEAARHLMACRDDRSGPVLVCCALGFSRSAAVMLTWLCLSGRVSSLDQAVAMLRQKHPQVVLSPDLLRAVDSAIRLQPMAHNDLPTSFVLKGERA